MLQESWSWVVPSCRTNSHPSSRESLSHSPNSTSPGPRLGEGCIPPGQVQRWTHQKRPQTDATPVRPSNPPLLLSPAPDPMSFLSCPSSHTHTRARPTTEPVFPHGGSPRLQSPFTAHSRNTTERDLMLLGAHYSWFIGPRRAGTDTAHAHTYCTRAHRATTHTPFPAHANATSLLFLRIAGGCSSAPGDVCDLDDPPSPAWPPPLGWLLFNPAAGEASFRTRPKSLVHGGSSGPTPGRHCLSGVRNLPDLHTLPSKNEAFSLQYLLLLPHVITTTRRGRLRTTYYSGCRPAFPFFSLFSSLCAVSFRRVVRRLHHHVAADSPPKPSC